MKRTQALLIPFALLALLFITGCDDEPTGGLGESCENFSHCGAGLSCVGQVCVTGSKSVPNNANTCEIIGCTKDSECTGFDSDGNVVSNGFGCKEGQCAPTCANNDDCTGFGKSVCANNFCEACGTKADCDEGETCIDNNCYDNCLSDNNCPSFYSCSTNSLCTWTGCTTDEECMFFTNDADSRCGPEKTCGTLCESDANCGGLDLCTGGICQNEGCTTDDQCKAAFAPGGYPTGVVGVFCVAPPETTDPIYASAVGVPAPAGEPTNDSEGGVVAEGGGEGFICPSDGNEIPFSAIGDEACDCAECEDEMPQEGG